MRWAAALVTLVCVCPALHGQCPPGASQLTMTKGEYSSQPGVVFTLENFSAHMVPQGRTAPQCLTKLTDIERGQVVVSASSLTRLFDRKIENNGGKQKEQISDLTVKMEDNQFAISGSIKKLIPIHFELRGPVEIADGHTLRFHADKIKADGIESKGLLDMLGMHLSSVLNPGPTKGVTVKDNTILFDTDALANIRGQIARAAISGDNLVVDFSQRAKTRSARSQPANHGASSRTAVASVLPKKK